MTYSKPSQATKDKYVGKIFKSNRFGDVEILEYITATKVVIKFLETGYITTEYLSSILSGHIRDKSLPTTCGVGYIDIEGASIGRSMTPVYKTWNAMMTRCYNENLRHKHPTYRDCVVSESFKYLSKFKEWYDKQIGHDQEGWHLDKDTLSNGSKIYSENTCCFIPPEINMLLHDGKSYRGKLPRGVILSSSGKRYIARVSMGGKYYDQGTFNTPEEAFLRYKEVKERHIKEVANKWKDKIDPKVYNALISYEVANAD